MRRVLITGAAGNLGGVLRQGLQQQGYCTRLTDIKNLPNPQPGEDFYPADLRDHVAVASVMEGVDDVVHFGAIPTEDTFPKIIEANIRGTFNVYEAARLAGVKRIIFASSNHVVGFHRREFPIDNTAMHRPDSYYGLSKAFGEDLGRFYSDKHGLSVISIRIGSCEPRPADARQLSTWISERDLVQLVCVSLEAPDPHFEVIYGISGNDRAWWDNTTAYAMGYRPEDNSEAYATEILTRDQPEGSDEIALQFQGGVFASVDFNGNPEDIL